MHVQAKTRPVTSQKPLSAITRSAAHREQRGAGKKAMYHTRPSRERFETDGPATCLLYV